MALPGGARLRAGLGGIGLRGGKGVKNAADFTASGGRYGTAVIFATLSASYVGGGYSSGNAAKAFPPESAPP